MQKFMRYMQYRNCFSCCKYISHVCARKLRAADETKSWMNEKASDVLSEEYGRDLASVQALQRKHEGLERDLDALEEKVHICNSSSNCNFCLVCIHLGIVQ